MISKINNDPNKKASEIYEMIGFICSKNDFRSIGTIKELALNCVDGIISAIEDCSVKVEWFGQPPIIEMENHVDYWREVRRCMTEI